MKQAVCALIFTKNNKILGVSRKDDQNSFGLIGGKVDDGETPEEALIRETKEETGLDIVKYDKIFERTEGNFKCSTYLCDTTGEVITDEAGMVKEVTWKELLNGSFGEYNEQLLQHLLNAKTLIIQIEKNGKSIKRKKRYWRHYSSYAGTISNRIT